MIIYRFILNIKMKFLLQCKNDEVKEMYANHGTYHKGDSGLDLYIIDNVIIDGGETKLVGLGVKCQLESHNWFGKKCYNSYLMFPRSSISKSPLRLANSVGLCDAGYTGELMAALHNTSKTPFSLKKGDRYVQLARADLGEINFNIVNELRSTTRSNFGFGSTGK
jgi:dUTP pyrophosphatase